MTLAHPAAVLHALPDAVVGLDLDGRVTALNPAAERLLVHPEHEAIGRPIGELAELEADLLAVATSGQPLRRDLTIRRSDGTRCELDVDAAPVTDESGAVVGIVACIKDVTADSAAQRAAAARADLLDEVSDAVACADTTGRVTYWSRGAARVYGWTPEEMIGRPLTVLCPDEGDAARMQQRIAAVAAGRSLEWTERRHQCKDGSVVFTEAQARPTRSADGLVTGMTFIARDISAQRDATMELERISWQDALTLLPNRQALLLHLQQLSVRPGEERVAVLLIDVDHLSLVNDAHGHDAGDEVLQLVARRLRRVAGTDDFVARFGGDEFAVVLRDPVDAQAVGAELLAAVAEPCTVGGVPLMLTASAGLVLCPPTDLADALRHADASMYEAKRQGRARVHAFDHSVTERATQLLTLSGALRQALRSDSDELSVHYQPIVALDSDRLVALEAFARWKHPEHGAIPPGRFVDVAEHTGLAAQLDLWTMRRAFAQYAELVDTLVISPETRVSVNIAAGHLHSADMTDAILSAAENAGVSPQQIMVEVTEDAVLRDVGPARASLERLRAQGVWIAVDDFGTGSSSLAHLRELPVDVLKIDRAFVRNITEEGDDLAIVAALTDLAHALGVTVIAEGVETAEQRRVLAELKCEQAQGYLWSPPVAHEELRDALDDVTRRGRAADAQARLGRRPHRDGLGNGVVGREHGLLRMLELHREGKSPATIASALNVEGFRTPEGLRWHRNTVAKALAPASRPTLWAATTAG